MKYKQCLNTPHTTVNTLWPYDTVAFVALAHKFAQANGSFNKQQYKNYILTILTPA